MLLLLNCVQQPSNAYGVCEGSGWVHFWHIGSLAVLEMGVCVPCSRTIERYGRTCPKSPLRARLAKYRHFDHQALQWPVETIYSAEGMGFLLEAQSSVQEVHL